MFILNKSRHVSSSFLEWITTKFEGIIFYLWMYVVVDIYHLVVLF